MIRVEDLSVVDGAGRAVLDGVSLDIGPGQRVAVVGESGSGKTTLALSLLGQVNPGLRVAGGRVVVGGENVLGLPAGALRSYRRRTVAYLPQDPASALTPTLRVRGQLAELADDRSDEALLRRLADVGLPADPKLLGRYPHQLSGGQQQRLALARISAGDPSVLVVDEPTTGLDAVARNRVLGQVGELVARRGASLLFVTHDLPAAGLVADRLVVLRGGTVMEEGPLTGVMAEPAAPYTRELIRAVPVIGDMRGRPQDATAPSTAAEEAPSALLRVEGLSAAYRQGGRSRTVVEGVSFSLGAGECLALLGVSGSGKTTLARCVSGFHRPSAGTITLDGQPLPAAIGERGTEQRRRIQVVPQHSVGSLNPRRSVGAALTRPLRRLRGMNRAGAAAESARLLALVGLEQRIADRYPAQLSGGQCQRVAIARALAADPDVLICDEMTSSLDTRVQAAVLDLVNRLRLELRLAVIVITHDLGVLARTADRVLALHEGVVCEEGPVAKVLGAPEHAWTRSLVEASRTTVAETLRPSR
ncbi:ABC transporter ATP-binding protein [Streptomyces sp. Wb2n-11]|uniref:ABC transporter ATP-binding protein n=1 Tax=Streptomyces sp. Wb2n-11 TaxID=1030533 RepID=UPI000A64EF7E|nr:ABC transporter ATP-binding protein [Streptomyces sp. Wb2n-11]